MPWKSDANRKAFDFLYESAKDINAMENYNAVIQSANYGFQPAYVPASSQKLLRIPTDTSSACGDEQGTY